MGICYVFHTVCSILSSSRPVARVPTFALLAEVTPVRFRRINVSPFLQIFIGADAILLAAHRTTDRLHPLGLPRWFTILAVLLVVLKTCDISALCQWMKSECEWPQGHYSWTKPDPSNIQGNWLDPRFPNNFLYPDQRIPIFLTELKFSQFHNYRFDGQCWKSKVFPNPKKMLKTVTRPGDSSDQSCWRVTWDESRVE